MDEQATVDHSLKVRKLALIEQQSAVKHLDTKNYNVRMRPLLFSLILESLL